jgi:hypothetical protein
MYSPPQESWANELILVSIVSSEQACKTCYFFFARLPVASSAIA